MKDGLRRLNHFLAALSNGPIAAVLFLTGIPSGLLKKKPFQRLGVRRSFWKRPDPSDELLWRHAPRLYLFFRNRLELSFGRACA